MYQDHLHKVTQDSEHQRQKRDEIIKAVKMQLSNTEAELQNTRAQHIANKYVIYTRLKKRCYTCENYKPISDDETQQIYV